MSLATGTDWTPRACARCGKNLTGDMRLIVYGTYLCPDPCGLAWAAAVRTSFMPQFLGTVKAPVDATSDAGAGGEVA